MSALTNLLQDAHFWIAIALAVFVVILWRAKIPSIAAKALDDAGAKVLAAYRARTGAQAAEPAA